MDISYKYTHKIAYSLYTFEYETLQNVANLQSKGFLPIHIPTSSL